MKTVTESKIREYIPIALCTILVIPLMVITQNVEFMLGYCLGILMYVGLESVLENKVYQNNPPDTNDQASGQEYPNIGANH